MRALFAVILALIWSALGARGEVKEPYLPAKDSYNILVIGDSLAAGLGAGLARAAESDQRLTVDSRYKDDSGLARPNFYDWNEAIPKILESNAVDIAVVLLGTNDTQSIADGNFRYAFATPEWLTAYGAQVGRVIDALKQAGIAVYWVSLPVMAEPRYNLAIAQIHEVQKAAAEVKSARYLDLRADWSGPQGEYAAFGLDEDGQMRQLRSKDGVHFLRRGNNKLAALVLAAIKKDIEAAAANQAAAAEDGAGKADPASPVFGQPGEAGAAKLVRPTIVEAAQQAEAEALAAVPVMPTEAANGAASYKDQAPQGSLAERLFRTGEAPPAEPGRFDDFSYAE